MRRLNHEDGATAVVVVLLLVVLFGSAAIAVDVGQLYQERRELQNGADAAAMAAAYDCAQGVIECSITGLELNNTIESYADANANDDASDAEIVGIDLDAQFITVRTSTRSGGNGFLTHFFAGMLGHPTTTVTTEATANWGRVPGTLEIFPLAFCKDTFLELSNLDDDGDGEADTDADGDPIDPMANNFPDSSDYPVFYKKPGDEAAIECPTTDSTYPGGVGWLDIEDPYFTVDYSTCTVTISAGEWMPGDPGADRSAQEPWETCVQRLKAKIDNMNDGTDTSPLLVPIFDGWRNPGASGEFHVMTFGAFRPTGYNFGGKFNYPASPEPCDGGGNRCVRGWFTDAVTFSGVGTGGEYYGLVSVDLVK